MAKIQQKIAEHVQSIIVRVLCDREEDRKKILQIMKRVVPNINKLKELLRELDILVKIEERENETIVTHGGYIAKFV